MSPGLAGLQTAVVALGGPAPVCSHCGGSGEEPAPMPLLLSMRLPIKTVSEANQRAKWAQIKRKKEQRAAVERALGVQRYFPAALVVTLTRIAPSARGLDGDNLQSAFKAIRDEVADWLGIDDRDPRVSWAYAQEKGAPKSYAVRIEIRERRGA